MAVDANRAIWEADTEGIDLISLTIGDLLDRQAEARPEKEALVYRYPEIGIDLRLNYRQYRAEVDRVAKGLIALGIEPGEHVAIWAPNVPEWIFVQLALARIGAILVTINTTLRAQEAEYVLCQGDVTTIFTVEEFRGNSYVEALDQIAPELRDLDDPVNRILSSPRLPRLKRAVLIGNSRRPGFIPYARVIALGHGTAPEILRRRSASVSPDDVAAILYTSGTTGFPKGVMLTHANIVKTMQAFWRGKDVSGDRFVSPMPLFHVVGVNLVVSALVTGMTLIQMIAFDPAKLLELLVEERATMSFCVPTMIIALLNHPRFAAGEFDLSSLRTIITGGAAVPVPLMKQAKVHMGVDCTIAFGQTESSGAGMRTLENDSFEVKSSTVGIPFPHLDAKIVDPLTSEPIGFGQTGELVLHGFCVMRGYYNMPAKTAEAIDADGWLHTGDLATMNSQGYLNIVGRIKDLVIRGGENLFPAEIEQFLMRHPAIADAQVVGVPDPYMGEELVALLRFKTGVETSEAEIRDYCRANISRQKVPKFIRFVTTYPVTASGKVKKFELRARLIQELGLEAVAAIRTA